MSKTKRAVKSTARFLIRADQIITALFILVFPALMLLLFISGNALWAPELVVGAVSFAVMSWMRGYLNAPRPYELTGEQPRIPRKGTGKSFPSRHVFCAFLIAVDWLAFQPWVGCGLLGCAIALAIIRVKGGVHFVRDVVAGALIGCGCGFIGSFLIVLLNH